MAGVKVNLQVVPLMAGWQNPISCCRETAMGEVREVTRCSDYTVEGGIRCSRLQAVDIDAVSRVI